MGQWKRISCKQSARWQHLSRLKDSAFFSLEPKKLVVKKHYNLYLRLVTPSGVCWSPMDQHVFAVWLIIEGATEKVLQFIRPLKSIYYKSLGFIAQKMYFGILQINSNKKFNNCHCFFHEKKIIMTLSEVPSIGLCWYYTKMSCSIYNFVH